MANIISIVNYHHSLASSRRSGRFYKIIIRTRVSYRSILQEHRWAESCRHRVQPRASPQLRRQRRLGPGAGGATLCTRAQQSASRARAGPRARQLRPGVQPVLPVRERDDGEDPEGRQGARRAGGRGSRTSVRVQLAHAPAGRRGQHESQVSPCDSATRTVPISGAQRSQGVGTRVLAAVEFNNIYK